MEISRELAKQLNEELVIAAKAIAAKHGLEYQPSGVSFSNVEVKLKTVFVLKEQKAKQMDNTFAALAHMYGMKPEWAGMSYEHNGRNFKIVGLNTRKPKNCVMLDCAGKNYICPASLIISKANMGMLF